MERSRAKEVQARVVASRGFLWQKQDLCIQERQDGWGTVIWEHRCLNEVGAESHKAVEAAVWNVDFI